MAAGREHDVVVLGATGYTGALTAEYLARHAPDGARIALAGRSPDKLAAVNERIGADLPVLHADVTDPGSLRDLADATAALITTVGPYVLHGEPVVAACAEAGTAYLDLTGEPEFMDTMYVRHHRRATETGARIVHACGFDSIPHDLGAYFTVQQLPEGVPLKVEGYVRGSGMASGGTLASAMLAMARARHMLHAARERRAHEPPVDRRVKILTGRPRHDATAGGWLLPAPTIDPQIVRLSARTVDRYGPDFSYGHYFAVRHAPVALGLLGGVATLATLAQLPPARRLISSRLPQGTGPSQERREKGWFNVRFRGEGGGERVITEVSGGDPGYGETAKMLGEAALCLALDDLPETAGQVSTAAAMGDALIARLRRAGIGFSVLD